MEKTEKLKVNVFKELNREFIVLPCVLKFTKMQEDILTERFESIYDTPLYTLTVDYPNETIFHVDNTPINRKNFLRMVRSINTMSIFK